MVLVMCHRGAVGFSIGSVVGLTWAANNVFVGCFASELQFGIGVSDSDGSCDALWGLRPASLSTWLLG